MTNEQQTACVIIGIITAGIVITILIVNVCDVISDSYLYGNRNKSK